MLKRFLITAALLLACVASARSQGIRFGDGFAISSNLVTAGPLSAVPSALIAICTYPANAVPCTNKATTYTGITLAIPCSTSIQIVLFGTSLCVGTTDARGNWGVWVAPGTYDFTITVSNGQSFGPFTVTAGIPAGTNLSVGTLTASGAITANSGIISSGPNNLGGTTTVSGPLTVNGTAVFTSGITTNALTDSGLTSGNCVQATAGGLLTTVAGPCNVGGAGILTATGAPVAGNLAKWSGATSLTNGDLAGDVTTAGTLTATVVKVNGNSAPSGAAIHQVYVATAANTFSLKTIPDCVDASGNHLNYTQSTDSFSCGLTTSGYTNWGRNTGCPQTGSGGGSGQTCSITLNTTEANTSYKVVCSGTGTITGYPIMLGVSTKSTTFVTVTYSNGTSNMAVASGWGAVECIITR